MVMGTWHSRIRRTGMRGGFNLGGGVGDTTFESGHVKMK